MKKIERTVVLSVVLFFVVGFQFCKPPTSEKYKIVYVNSYHRGHPSSDEIMDAVIKEFKSDSFELFSYIMDTKRNSAQKYIENKSAQLYDSITAIDPDIVIVSDDRPIHHMLK